MDAWRVPGYTELKVLGEGGQGRVVLARHDGTGRPAAIKYLSARHTADARFRETFRQEAELLSRLRSPYVAQLFGLVEADGGVAIVMEAVDGASLRALLAERGALPPEGALALLKGSLLGLAAAHENGIVHRDYKPANVVVRADGLSKLIDFGIAVDAGASGPSGTPVYMAPEQWRAEPASPATDVYAATCVFVECVAGRRRGGRGRGRWRRGGVRHVASRQEEAPAARPDRHPPGRAERAAVGAARRRDVGGGRPGRDRLRAQGPGGRHDAERRPARPARPALDGGEVPPRRAAGRLHRDGPPDDPAARAEAAQRPVRRRRPGAGRDGLGPGAGGHRRPRHRDGVRASGRPVQDAVARAVVRAVPEGSRAPAGASLVPPRARRARHHRQAADQRRGRGRAHPVRDPGVLPGRRARLFGRVREPGRGRPVRRGRQSPETAGHGGRPVSGDVRAAHALSRARTRPGTPNAPAGRTRPGRHAHAPTCAC
ncbi:serine/threonine protein kinase [Actinomadura harenae]|uniref:non-specific serine/threonine protein kinase n=1 Tax=Actinomadura harenae TaxID=2483351 RepID=A0A3M2M2R9_9ACTN|nr:serine/threonine protein kinase [Actinomadura harenae]